MSGWTIWPWPFFEERHQALAARLAEFRAPVEGHPEGAALERACRDIARALGAAGFLDIVVPAAETGAAPRIDVRALCLAREALAYDCVLADTVIAMQGIGAGALWMHGSAEQKARFLPGIRSGAAIAAFALTEPDTGSDVANITARGERQGDHYILNGAKTFISNAPFADHYIVVVRTGEAPGAKGLSAFIVEKDTPGLVCGDAIDLMAPHPAGPLLFENCRVPVANRIGEAGRGFAIAMATFDIFRTSVGAAAIGMARRALDETLARVRSRRLFNAAMAEIAGVQAKIADMSIDLDLGALAVYRAAWTKDTTGGRCSREASMAKFAGTEAASRIIDSAVQIFGGMGVTRGSIVEQLYREVRPTRIYEGASEVQKLVIARTLLAETA